MNKQYKSVGEVFEETKQKLNVEQHDESANLATLKRVLDMINGVVQQYGSNSLERSHLHGAENLIHDAIATIGQKDIEGVYTAQGTIEYEDGKNKQLADKAQVLMKKLDKVNDDLDTFYDDLGHIVHYEFDEKNIDTSDERQVIMAKWKNDYMGNLEEILIDWPYNLR